jgi:hypothetical protein
MRDDDFPKGLLGFEVANGIWNIIKREYAIDHRTQPGDFHRERTPDGDLEYRPFVSGSRA